MTGNFNNIQKKLQKFISKYYTNELIKGAILFVSFGLLYFLITLIIEYFLWLSPIGRTVLFFAFLGVELILLIKFILIPLTKLLGIRTGLTQQEASKIIGKHFPEVDDRLLNVLQLNESSHKSELLLASIEQKAAALNPIPFKRAINFSKNTKYLKYLAIPLVIWGFSAITGNQNLFNESLHRVVHYKTAYEPPAPFSFRILNENLQIVEGASLELNVATVGDIIPENVSIHFDNQVNLMKEVVRGQFSFSFSNLTEGLDFYISANGIRSAKYRIEVINTPRITNFEMLLSYPKYTAKRNEQLQNTGNTIVPEGTVVRWNIQTISTDTVHFVSNRSIELFDSEDKGVFSYSQPIVRSLNYQISTSNQQLISYEKLDFSIQVIKDEFPKIEIKSDIDSIQRGPIQFAGQLTDDYGLSKLQMVFYKTEDREQSWSIPIPISNTVFEDFYFVFAPETDPRVEKGHAYTIYFEVFDNDGVNGAKSVQSQRFQYYQKTNEELERELHKEQEERINALYKTSKNSKELNKELNEFSKKLKNKTQLNWNDKKQFEKFLKRQEQYQKMLEDHTDKLKQNLDDQLKDINDPLLEQKKDELKKRIKETQELQEKNRLLKELKKMADKMDKEDMIRKLEKLTEQNKQENRTLERMLEMSKRFFVEKKAGQIARKLDTLANKQTALYLKKDEQNTSLKQTLLNEAFKEIDKDFKELRKENSHLAQPMDFPPTKGDREKIDESMNEAKEKLEKEEEHPVDNKSKFKESAKMSQKSAAQKMKKLSKKMSEALQMIQGETISEDISTLRGILENLLSFSFDQEKLMMVLNGKDSGDAEYPKYLKKQQLLKEHFEHIDDSIYALALRLPELSNVVQKDLTEVHYNINRSLANIADNRIHQGRFNQQYAMTAANNIAELLSDLLNSLQNPSLGDGKGEGNGFQLPDIIKKQGEMKGRMKNAMQPGEQGEPQDQNGEKGKQGSSEGKGKNKEGDGKSDEDTFEELYEIYQEQQRLREELENILENKRLQGSLKNQAKEAVRRMEWLENQLLEKGISPDVLQQMQRLEHELLKLDEAIKEQGEDLQRKATSNKREYKQVVLPQIRGEKLFFNVDEILIRESLPLRTNYKKKVQQYFKNATL
ncbi:hypothetical protein MWU59_02585 [Flavobacteriaceae bacterium F08102]|nr:hypothetical protein [Flavobacteriaceae bacterium F08102]